MGCYCDLMGVNHEKWWFNEVNGSSSWKMGDFTWLKMTQKLCFFGGIQKLVGESRGKNHHDHSWPP